MRKEKIQNVEESRRGWWTRESELVSTVLERGLKEHEKEVVSELAVPGGYKIFFLIWVVRLPKTRSNSFPLLKLQGARIDRYWKRW